MNGEEQFTGLDIHLGDRFTTVGPDGVTYTDYIHSVRYLSAEPEIRQQPSGWRRVLRNWTPRRWRKPLPITRPYRPASTEFIGKSGVVHRKTQWTEGIDAVFDRWREK